MAGQQGYNQFMLRKERCFFIILGVVFIGIVSLPYLWAYNTAGSDYQFGGFLLNPIDGNSYLAKMYQGWLGSWKFSLPYTSQPGSGGYLFLFYLALGQIARLVNGELLSVYHAARIIGSVILAFSLLNFYRQTLSNRRSLWLAFGLALFGSGLGWLAASFGLFTADFWVAEGYPFLSSYANPHFPLGIAILVWLLSPNLGFIRKCRAVYHYLPELLWVLLAFILAQILPFGVVISGVVLGGFGLWEFLSKSRSKGGKLRTKLSIGGVIRGSDTWWKLIFVLFGGLPMMIYQFWITQSDPQLAVWNAQNITASPGFWDLILSYSPILFLAIPGGYLAWKSKDGNLIILLLWAILGLLLLYIPWGLQRRFILGYMIPLAGLAAIALDRLFSKNRMTAFGALVLVILLIIPTNLMIIMGGIQAVNTKEPKVLLSQEEIAAMDWIASNTSQDALFLASPQMGLYIPAYTGRRVLYGHPFETVNAADMESAVIDFLNGRITLEDLSVFRDVDFIFYGHREHEVGRFGLESEYETVYSSSAIQILEISGLYETSSLEDDQ
jgi:hypothetical protein